MDALKTYFNRFRKLSSRSGDRSNSRSPKRRKKDGLTRNGSLNENLTQTYSNGVTSASVRVLRERASDGNLRGDTSNGVTNGISHRGRTDAMKNIYEKPLLSSSLSNSGLHTRKRDKTPPPAKPPRRDKVLSVTIECSQDKDLGIVLDAVPHENPNGSPRGRLCSEGAVTCSSSPLSSYGGHVVRVVHIKDGSPASNGQVKVNDEVLDINGWSMIKENTGSARLLLANAVRSGKVTMTLRRRKKRPAPPPPPRKDYNMEEPLGSGTSETGVQYSVVQKGNKSIGNTHFSHSLDSIPRQLSNTGSSICHDNNYDGSNLTLNSLGSLGGSNDDVFCDTLADDRASLSRVHTSNLSVNSEICDNNNYVKSSPSACGRDSVMSKSDYVNIEIVNKTRTQSTSAVEDVVHWNLAPVEMENNEETRSVQMNTAEIARQKRGLKASTIPQNGNDLTSFRSDPDIMNQHKHYYKKKSKGWRSLHDRSENHTPTSCCSSSESSHGNSPPKKRIVTRMHLLKDEYGLGIHIAGGKGSRKGDIGIFVAGVTESGAAFRDGRLKRGDELLMINGKSLIGLTHGEAVEVLRNSPKLVQLVVAAKMRKSSSIASTNSYSVPSLLTDCHSNKPADDTITVPKVTAQTPHGTVFNLDELIERFDHSLAGSKQADRSDSLPKFENCQTLIINKGAKGKGLGFTIVGGSDSEKGNLGIYVRRIFPRGLVAEEGAMKEGDEIIQLNGQQMRGLTHSEALAKFRQLKKGPVTIVFCRKTRSRASSPSVRLAKTSSADLSSEGSPVSTPGHSPYGSCSDLTTLDDHEDPINTINCISTSSSYDNFLDVNQTVSPVQFESSESAILDVSASAGERPKLSQKEESDYEITLEKELGIGLGISLIRKDTAGISHIYIQDIYHGSPADKDGRLHKGDMITEVNGKTMQGLSLLDAYQYFRNLQPGSVNIVVKRKRDFLDDDNENY